MKHTHAKPAGYPTWTDLMTPDTDKARTFYHAIFGWHYHVAEEFGGYINAHIDEQLVAGIVGPNQSSANMPAAWTVYFASHDIDADVAKAVALGGSVMAPVMSVGEIGKMAILQDPQGAVFGLWQAGTFIGSMLSQDIGAMDWVELVTSNATEANTFYKALLGATSSPMPGGMEYHVLQQGEVQHGGIMQADPSWGLDGHSFWVTYWSVKDADATIATALQYGGTINGSVDDTPFGRLASLVDPTGAQFKIRQHQG
jgi:uncharacterized protein